MFCSQRKMYISFKNFAPYLSVFIASKVLKFFFFLIYFSQLSDVRETPQEADAIKLTDLDEVKTSTLRIGIIDWRKCQKFGQTQKLIDNCPF